MILLKIGFSKFFTGSTTCHFLILQDLREQYELAFYLFAAGMLPGSWLVLDLDSPSLLMLGFKSRRESVPLNSWEFFLC